MPSMNFKKLWKRRSVSITECDPTYKVIYLGNVLTGWAKGEGCVDKPLATLWRNYCQSARPDIPMKVTICGAGLRAVTTEHGLTEYWSHRVTHCSANAAYPRVFCWVYRHEGRRLKQELRCHAVLCSKQVKAELMSTQLKDRLSIALHEFRREKAIRQNARLSLVHALYDSAVLPMRKAYLITGSANYRPPLERSKSAPKLGAIEEILGEEEEDEQELAIPNRRSITDSRLVSPLVVIPRKNIHSYRLPSTTERLEAAMPLERHGFPLRERAQATASDDIQISNSVPLIEETEKDTRNGGLESSVSVVNFSSSPDLFFYPPPADQNFSSLHPPDSSNFSHLSPTDQNLALLETLKDKLLGHAEESLTSDQPESIGSSSCSSSSCDGGGDEEVIILEVGTEDVLIGKERKGSSVKLSHEEEEDNISEESGYSEDKECLESVRVKV